METKELIKRIRKLEIKTRGLTRHIFSGQYHSAFKGKGMAFSEVRDYHFGDEVKTIDWNVTARFNEPFVKVFEEERELTVLLMVDISGSSKLAGTTKSKFELALEVSAILAFSALNNNDNVGAVLFSNKIEKYIQPDSGKKHTLRLLREIIETNPENTNTDISQALKFIQKTQKKRAVVFVISDFMDENSYLESFKIVGKKHDIIAIHISDPIEGDLPSLGFIQLENAESGEKTWVNSNNKNSKKIYKRKYLEKQEEFRNNMERSAIDHTMISTEEDFVKPLIKLFKRRK